jgi:hypothetical protein
MKKLIQFLKELYIKIKCAFCCKSNCSIQIGEEEEKSTETTKSTKI